MFLDSSLMRAYGPNSLRAQRMAKALGGGHVLLSFFLFYLEAYHSAGEVLVLSALVLPFFNFHTCA